MGEYLTAMGRRKKLVPLKRSWQRERVRIGQAPAPGETYSFTPAFTLSIWELGGIGIEGADDCVNELVVRWGAVGGREGLFS